MDSEDIPCKVIVSNKVWRSFLDHHPHLYQSLWDLIPPEIDVLNVEPMIYDGRDLYELMYKDIPFLVWEDEIEEFVCYHDGRDGCTYRH